MGWLGNRRIARRKALGILLDENIRGSMKQSVLEFARYCCNPALYPMIDGLMASPKITAKLDFVDSGGIDHQTLYLTKKQSESTFQILNIWLESGNIVGREEGERDQVYRYNDVASVLKGIEDWADRH
jgi:hypothetical protein